MRFGATPAACKQAMKLGFAGSMQRLSSAAQEDMRCVQQHAHEQMQKVVTPHLPFRKHHSLCWLHSLGITCITHYRKAAEYDLFMNCKIVRNRDQGLHVTACIGSQVQWCVWFTTASVLFTARCLGMESVHEHVMVLMVQAIDKYDSKYAGERPHDSHLTIPDPASIW